MAHDTPPTDVVLVFVDADKEAAILLPGAEFHHGSPAVVYNISYSLFDNQMQIQCLTLAKSGIIGYGECKRSGTPHLAHFHF